jgi:hypothetical protein
MPATTLPLPLRGSPLELEHLIFGKGHWKFVFCPLEKKVRLAGKFLLRKMHFWP